MIKYEKITTQFGDEQIIKIEEDGKTWAIPADESNSDYQAYLRWKENPNADTWTEPQLTKY